METLTKISKKPGNEETSHAAIIHISSFASWIGLPLGSVLGPLFTWMIWRKQSQFVDENGKEAMNFNISLLLYQIIILIIGLIFFLSPLLRIANKNDTDTFNLILSLPGLWLLVAGLGLISLFRLIMILVAVIKSGNGELFRYPLTIRLIK